MTVTAAKRGGAVILATASLLSIGALAMSTANADNSGAGEGAEAQVKPATSRTVNWGSKTDNPNVTAKVWSDSETTPKATDVVDGKPLVPNTTGAYTVEIDLGAAHTSKTAKFTFDKGVASGELQVSDDGQSFTRVLSYTDKGEWDASEGAVGAHRYYRLYIASQKPVAGNTTGVELKSVNFVGTEALPSGYGVTGSTTGKDEQGKDTTVEEKLPTIKYDLDTHQPATEASKNTVDIPYANVRDNGTAYIHAGESYTFYVKVDGVDGADANAKFKVVSGYDEKVFSATVGDVATDGVFKGQVPVTVTAAKSGSYVFGLTSAANVTAADGIPVTQYVFVHAYDKVTHVAAPGSTDNGADQTIAVGAKPFGREAVVTGVDVDGKTPSHDVVQTVTWSAIDSNGSPSDVVTVDAKTGAVTGVKEGSAIIRATSTDNKEVFGDWTVNVVKSSTPSDWSKFAPTVTYSTADGEKTLDKFDVNSADYELDGFDGKTVTVKSEDKDFKVGEPVLAEDGSVSVEVVAKDGTTHTYTFRAKAAETDKYSIEDLKNVTANYKSDGATVEGFDYKESNGKVVELAKGRALDDVRLQGLPTVGGADADTPSTAADTDAEEKPAADWSANPVYLDAEGNATDDKTKAESVKYEVNDPDGNNIAVYTFALNGTTTPDASTYRIVFGQTGVQYVTGTSYTFSVQDDKGNVIDDSDWTYTVTDKDGNETTDVKLATDAATKPHTFTASKAGEYTLTATPKEGKAVTATVTVADKSTDGTGTDTDTKNPFETDAWKALKVTAQFKDENGKVQQYKDFNKDTTKYPVTEQAAKTMEVVLDTNAIASDATLSQYTWSVKTETVKNDDGSYVTTSTVIADGKDGESNSISYVFEYKPTKAPEQNLPGGGEDAKNPTGDKTSGNTGDKKADNGDTGNGDLAKTGAVVGIIAVVGAAAAGVGGAFASMKRRFSNR